MLAAGWAPRLGAGLAVAVSAGSGLLLVVLLLTLAGLWPGTGHWVRSWDHLPAAVLGGLVAVGAAGAGAVVAGKAVRGSLRPRAATVLALVLALALAAGGLVLLRSTSVSYMPMVETDAARSS